MAGESSYQEHYTIIEIEDKLASLNKTDITRLVALLKKMGPERVKMTAEDLLHHTLADLLSGRRSWPKIVEPIVFIRNAASSILNNAIESKQWRAERSYHHEDVSDLNEQVEGLVMRSPEESLSLIQKGKSLEQAVQEIQTLFERDDEVLCVIRQMLKETATKAIKAACVLTDSAYERVMKRLRYNVRKAFPQGISAWEVS